MICTDGTSLPPTLIYPGDSGDMWDTWLKDFNASNDKAYFSVTSSGYSSDAVARSWFENVFIRHAREKTTRGRILLILDGHNSHVNVKFLELADKHWVIIAVLPPHTMYQLQPLDVGIFSPLTTSYSKHLDLFVWDACPFNCMKKAEFWQIFSSSWAEALSEKNILSAFKATGIWPHNPSKVLDKLKSPLPKSPQLAVQTPNHAASYQNLCRDIYWSGENPGPAVNQALWGGLKMSTEMELYHYMVLWAWRFVSKG